MEPTEMFKPGQVTINGHAYEVTPNAQGYEVSKRVYRMLCDHPTKLIQFDALLKACGREIRQAAKDAEKNPRPCDE